MTTRTERPNVFVVVELRVAAEEGGRTAGGVPIPDRAKAKRFLERALESLFPDHRFTLVIPGQRSEFSRLARSMVLMRRLPLLVLAEADSADDLVVAERRIELLRDLEATRSPRLVEVVMVRPYLDPAALLPKEVLKRIVGATLHPSELELARHAPREFWLLIRERLTAPPLAQLKARDYRSLASVPPFRAIQEFLERPAVQEHLRGRRASANT